VLLKLYKMFIAPNTRIDLEKKRVFGIQPGGGLICGVRSVPTHNIRIRTIPPSSQLLPTSFPSLATPPLSFPLYLSTMPTTRTTTTTITLWVPHPPVAAHTCSRYSLMTSPFCTHGHPSASFHTPLVAWKTLQARPPQR
jgi:hypothetical protein